MKANFRLNNFQTVNFLYKKKVYMNYIGTPYLYVLCKALQALAYFKLIALGSETNEREF